MNRELSKVSGFTLIEVVIALMILTFLSLLTVQSIQRALKAKTKIQTDIDKSSSLRDALKIIERDIHLAFNYRDPNIALFNMAQKYRLEEKKKKKAKPPPKDPKPPPDPGNPENPTPEAGEDASIDAEKYKTKTETIYTQFIGEPESLNFTSLSNVRLTDSSPISSQAEIGYSIKSCRRRSNQEQSSRCLWRRVSNFIHEDITKEGEETVLLENVSEFKLRYLGPGKDGEWVDTWITTERGDDITKGKFPHAVEITMAIQNPDRNANDKILRMTTVASLHNPNNPKEEKPENTGEATAPAQ